MAPRRIPSTTVLLTALTVWAAPFPTADPVGTAHAIGTSYAASRGSGVPGRPSAFAGFAGRAGDAVTAATGDCVNATRVRDEGMPWALQRLPFDVLWRHTRGEGVRIAVIDTGVDDSNPQLRSAVDARAGADFLAAGGPEGADRAVGADGRAAKDAHDSEDAHEAHDGTLDTVGHGTKVAGIIAARPQQGTGFVGLAPGATIIPIRHNDERHTGSTHTLALAIDHAIAEGAHIINISQATAEPEPPGSPLGRAVRRALDQDIVVIASAGNRGTDAQPRNTFPAAFDGVLAVAASDRDNERAVFSQPGTFIGVAAPGVDIVSDRPRRWPLRGQRHQFRRAVCRRSSRAATGRTSPLECSADRLQDRADRATRRRYRS